MRRLLYLPISLHISVAEFENFDSQDNLQIRNGSSCITQTLKNKIYFIYLKNLPLYS